MKKKARKTYTINSVGTNLDRLGGKVDTLTSTVKNLNGTVETSAIMVANGFTKIGKEFDEIRAVVQGTNNRIDDLATHRATKEEVYHLGLRLEKVEKKLGMKK